MPSRGKPSHRSGSGGPSQTDIDTKSASAPTPPEHDTGPTVASTTDPTPEKRGFPDGTQVGHYTIDRQLGSGGFSSVYEVIDRRSGRPAAMKVLTSEGSRVLSIVQRFRQEVRAINRIRHPNIAQIYEYDQLPDGRPYYIMELVEGVTLSKMVRERGRLSLPECVELVEAIGAALSAAHAVRIVHRDIKPSNVIVGDRDIDRGGVRVVKLIDFGVAKLIHPGGTHGLTEVGQRIGTPVCMAPEQIRGLKIDHRVDVYGLGVLLFYLLTGKYPFSRAMPSDLEQLILNTPPPRPSAMAPVPPEVDAVVLRCLEKEPDQRYDSVEELLHALNQAASAQTAAGEAPVLVRRALGIYIESIYLGPSGESEPDDDALDDMEELVDMAEGFLQESGFTVLLQTGITLLCAAVLPVAPEAEQLERARALNLANELYQALMAREDACPNVHIYIAVHIDQSKVSERGSALAITGGAITSTVWVPRPPRAGVAPTPAFLNWSPALPTLEELTTGL